MKLQSRVFFRTILDACSWRKNLSLHLLGSSIWYSPLPVEKMRTNYEFHQLKNNVKCGNNSSRWRNGTRACQRSSCPLTIPPPHPSPSILWAFSVQWNAPVPYLVSKGFPSCQKQCDKDQSKPLFYYFMADSSWLLSLGSSWGVGAGVDCKQCLSESFIVIWL